MRVRRFLLLSIFIATIAVEAIGYRGYRSDVAAWRPVGRSLAQLQLAVEQQPAAGLTAQIAAARAAVEAFAASPHRFPRDHGTRLRAAERGLAYLAIAAQEARSIRTWESMTAYPDVTRLSPRVCDGDHLSFSRALISEAFGVAGLSLIKQAVSVKIDQNDTDRQQGFYGPLDLARETAACKRLDRNAMQVAANAAAAVSLQSGREKYRIEISNPTGCLMTPYSDDQAIPIPHSQIYRFHFPAARKARIEKVFCNSGKPADSIVVSINGRRCDPAWLLDESGINYATELLPRTPLVLLRDGAP